MGGRPERRAPSRIDGVDVIAGQEPEPPRPLDLGGRATVVLLSLIVACAFAFRLAFLLGIPGLTGYDAYFYACQVRELLQGGQLRFPDISLAYPILAACAALVGDVPLGIETGSALAGALLPLPVYLFGKELGRSRATGIIAAALCARSDVHLIFSFEFLKNAWGLVPFALFVRSAARGWRRRVRGDFVWAGLWGVAAALTHRSAGAMVLLLGAMLGMAGLGVGDSSRAGRPRWAAGALAVGCLAGLLGILAVHPSGSLATAEILRENLSPRPHFAPLTILTRYGMAFGPTRLVELGVYYLLAAAGLLVVLSESLFPGSRFRGAPRSGSEAHRDTAFLGSLVVLLLVLLNPFWSPDWNGLFFRLLRLGLIPSLAIFSLLLGRLCAGARGDRIERRVAVVVTAACLASQALSARPPFAETHPHYESGREAVVRLASRLPDGALVAAPHGWQFFVTYSTGLPATSHPPARPLSDRPIWWLSTARSARQLDTARVRWCPTTPDPIDLGGTFAAVEDGLGRCLRAHGIDLLHDE